MDSEKRKHASEAISRQTVGTGSTRDDVTRIRIRNILDSADKDAQVAPSKRNDGYRRACPGDVLSRRPSEPEETDRQPKAAQHGGIKSVLGRNLVRRVIRGLLSIEEYLTGHDSRKAKEAADDNSKENQAGLFSIKAIHQAKRVWNTAKEAEKGAEIDGDIEADERNDGFGEKHENRSNGGHDGESLDALAHRRKWRDLEATLLSQTALEDWVKSLSDEATQGDGEGGEEEHCPFSPTPALVDGNERANNGAVKSI